MTRSFLILLLGAALATSACSRLQKDDGVRFEGQRFQIKAKKLSKEDRSKFVATAAPVSVTLEGARQAAAYGGTEYCIKEYGTSLIAWDNAPDAPEEELQFDGNRLVVTGQCKP